MKALLCASGRSLRVCLFPNSKLRNLYKRLKSQTINWRLGKGLVESSAAGMSHQTSLWDAMCSKK